MFHANSRQGIACRKPKTLVDVMVSVGATIGEPCRQQERQHDGVLHEWRKDHHQSGRTVCPINTAANGLSIGIGADHNDPVAEAPVLRCQSGY